MWAFITLEIFILQGFPLSSILADTVKSYLLYCLKIDSLKIGDYILDILATSELKSNPTFCCK